jgi:hypothetical protein
MSTKNLARTVIEGGRANFNKLQRRHSNAVERARVHQLERALCRASELDGAVFEPRQPVYRAFDDKLGPALRWLRSQAGRPWDKVRSELFARFDIRTTAGRHILFDHLLSEVSTVLPTRYERQRRFTISARGILLYRGRERFRAFGRRAPLCEPEHVLVAWLAGRRVAAHGERFYWLVPTKSGAYRQGRELDTPDSARFAALPAWFREQHQGPISPPEVQR